MSTTRTARGGQENNPGRPLIQPADGFRILTENRSAEGSSTCALRFSCPTSASPAVSGSTAAACSPPSSASARPTTPSTTHPGRSATTLPARRRDDSWRTSSADPRVRLTLLDWPVNHSLADPLDPAVGGAVAAARPDVVYCSYYTGLAAPPCPQVVTFTTPGSWKCRTCSGMWRDAGGKRSTHPPAIAALTCVSADARDRISRLLPFDPARAVVVWHALPDSPADLETGRGPDAVVGSLWPGGDRVADWGRYFLPAGRGGDGVQPHPEKRPRRRGRLPPTAAGTARLVVAGTGVLHDRMLAELLPPRELADGGIAGEAWRNADSTIVVYRTSIAGRSWRQWHGRPRSSIRRGTKGSASQRSKRWPWGCRSSPVGRPVCRKSSGTPGCSSTRTMSPGSRLRCGRYSPIRSWRRSWSPGVGPGGVVHPGADGGRDATGVRVRPGQVIRHNGSDARGLPRASRRCSSPVRVQSTWAGSAYHTIDHE